MYTIKVNNFDLTLFDNIRHKGGGIDLKNNGMLKIHLSSLLKTSGMSKNKFCQKAEMQYLQLKGYIDNTITRFDTDVLIRICHTLNCSISDLLEYIPPEKPDIDNNDKNN